MNDSKARPDGARVKLTGSEALVRVLKASGVTDYFGIAGANLSGILKSINNDSELRYVGTRHEASAAFMAAGTFHASGRVAVCMGELGPGSCNLMAGMGTAYNNNLALLVITSNMPASVVHPSQGVLMDFDGRQLFQSVTKWSEQVNDVRRIPMVVRQALRQALTGCPGPAHLDFPANVLFGTAEFDTAELDVPLERMMPVGRQPADPAYIQEAARLLANAKRPLLIAGGGVAHSEAAPEFRAIMSLLGAPATATQMGIGVVPSISPSFIGHAGAVGGPAIFRAMKEADVVMAVGCRFSSWLWEDGVAATPGWPYQELIHIDRDPAVPGRARPASVPIAGDAKAVLGQLLAELANHPVGSLRDADWVRSVVEDYRAHRARLEKLAASTGEVMHPAKLAKILGELIPSESLVVYDGGHTSFWSNEFTPAAEPRTRFNDPGMAQLGFGTPYALALKFHYPDRPVFNITGDGAFGFTIQELDTARRYGLNTVNIIHNNAAWGIIQSGQQRNGFELGARLEGTDYTAIARAFGCYGERVTRPEDIKPALERALESNLPAVLDVQVFFELHPSMEYFRRTTPLL